VITDASNNTKIYHIVHISKLPSIISDGFLFSDVEMCKRPQIGEIIGMNNIKLRRREELTIPSHPDLFVGECVPFYFCPRSVMLYLLYKGNHMDVAYRGGQEPIIHLVSNLKESVEWAYANNLRWAFTDTNAGARYFEAYTELNDLNKLDWHAIQATQWDERDVKDKKQAEFLIEHCFSWDLVDEVGVFSFEQLHHVQTILRDNNQELPIVRIQRSWYY